MVFETRRSEAESRAAISYAQVLTIAIVVLAFASGLPATSAAQDRAQPAAFSQAGPSHEFKGAPHVFEWVFQAHRGSSPFDRIALHRVTLGPNPLVHPNLVMLYLPGTNMNGEVAIDDPRYSLPLFMASHGVDFWALDYRTHFVPPAASASDLATLKGWTNEVFESDIDAAVHFIAATTGRKRIFVGGFSRGVSFAYLYAAQHPSRVAGLMLFDGWIPDRKAPSPPPARYAQSAPPGRYADDIGGRHLTYEKRNTLMEIVIKDPNAPAPIPKYKTAGENLEHVVYDSADFGGHGGLANPMGGFSAPDVLARVLIRYDRYWPAIQDGENSFTPAILESLGRSKIPVIAFSSTNISKDWPARVTKSASSTGSSDVTVKRLAGWGHLDVICGTHAEEQVFEPALEWLRRHRK
jgi:pimeloyl-ACP methyl ester carboxylesterase